MIKHAQNILLLAVIWIIAAIHATAQPAADLEAFKRTPILHNGRIKPIDTLARSILQDIHGSPHLGNISASAWLLEVTTSPKKSVLAPVFLEQNSEVKEFLALDTTQKYFPALTLGEAFAEKSAAIENLLAADPNTLTPTQQDVLSLYAKTLYFTSLLEGRALESAKDSNPYRIEAELLYNACKPYNWALTFYALAIILSLLCFVPKIKFKITHMKKAALIFALAGTTMHGLAIATRIFILARPPVGTLYESVLFVSLICALIAIILFLKRAHISHLLAGTITAFILLFIAPQTAVGETMDTLSAVLNTNFWLATHVLCITIGYSVSLIAGCTAHFALARPSDELGRSIYRLSLLALLFTTIGTILGGIWADQSWGRFWGWDPKENGALLIVLWLIWLQHGKISGKISLRTFLAGMAAINIIVALAWFGVNLLSTGLHSYGFTNRMGLSLLAFCTIEVILIGLLWIFMPKINLKKIKS